MRTATDPLRAAPNPPPPRRVWRDWALVGLVFALAVPELLLRDDLAWPVPSVAVAVVLAATILWRRTHPLPSAFVAFGSIGVLHVAMLVWPPGHGTPLLWSTGIPVLLIPYVLLRWAVLRDATIGMAVAFAWIVVSSLASATPLQDTIVGVLFFGFSAALGASMRYRASSRYQQLAQVRLREREQLARELHDSVAHHVSAIAIRAQGGQLVAAADPKRAVEALAAIEKAASQALGEMRAMVGALRDGDGEFGEVELTPQPGVRDVESLAGDSGDGPRVDVTLTGHLDDLSPAVGTAVYRLAQESVTNAVRHARHATRVEVRVAGEESCVRLSVHDDGDVVPMVRTPAGFGLLGMAERTALLGGTFEAGPAAGGGWTVAAVLPRTGATP
jgi:signal transduction histidine kinase